MQRCSWAGDPGPEVWRPRRVGGVWRVWQHVCFRFFSTGSSQWDESGPELQGSSLTSTFHIMKSCSGGGGGGLCVLRAPALGEPHSGSMDAVAKDSCSPDSRWQKIDEIWRFGATVRRDT